MIHYSKIVILTLLFLFCTSGSHGQTVSDGGSAQKPVPVNPRVQMEFLVGSFTTTTSIPPGPSMPEGATGNGTSVISWALDSMFLSIEEQSLNTLFGQYKGHGMLGFDPQMHQFVLSMFNNFGDHPTYHGDFVGDTLVLQTKIQSPRGAFDQKILCYKDGSAVKLRVMNDAGKGFQLTLEETSTPVSKSAK